jgi:hypothetical protein
VAEALVGVQAAHSLPKAPQRGLSAAAPARHQAVGQGHRIHGARAGAADPRNFEPGLVEQAVEHAPGERTV